VASVLTLNIVLVLWKRFVFCSQRCTFCSCLLSPGKPLSNVLWKSRLQSDGWRRELPSLCCSTERHFMCTEPGKTFRVVFRQRRRQQSSGNFFRHVFLPPVNPKWLNYLHFRYVSRNMGSRSEITTIFGIYPELPTHYTTFRGLWWWLRVTDELPHLALCQRRVTWPGSRGSEITTYLESPIQNCLFTIQRSGGCGDD